MIAPEPSVATAISTAEAGRIAREVFDVAATPRRLPGEYDDNFHLQTANGAGFVLKIMHPARERELVDLQCSALRHLAQRAPQLALPQVRPTRTGELFDAVATEDGSSRLAWMLSFIPGKVLADVTPHSPELLRELGRMLGEMDAAMASFAHPAAVRELKWDSARALWIRDCLHYIPDDRRRALLAKFVRLSEKDVVPSVPQLRRSVIYGDANDYNVIVSEAWPNPKLSVIDFGDMHEGITVSELAIAAAYAILGKQDVLAASAELARGYHSALPLTEKEAEVLFPLMAMRLAVSVVNSAERKTLKNDPYITVSEAPAWEALERLDRIHPRFANYIFREACGLAPVARSQHVSDWLRRCNAASVLDVDVRSAPCMVFDLSVGSAFLGANPTDAQCAVLTLKIFGEMKRSGAAFGVGRYNEARGIYGAPQFAKSKNLTDERRTIHLGIDLFAPPGTPVRAPLDAEVHLVARHDAPLDYGPLVILKHTTGDGDEFCTLYGHLEAASTASLRAGQKIRAGEGFCRIGDVNENGGWPPHLHFQIILDLLDLGADFPGVALPSQRAVWTSLSPDPNLLLRIPAERFPIAELDSAATLNNRRRLMGHNLSVSYEKPLKIVRGWMQYLYDDTGRAFLDLYNNVPLVGHSHPRVVEAVQRQIGLLNTNTRYLHDNVVRYAERLLSLLPDPLRVCYFVNSGSEANELALRLARAHTRRVGVIVLEHAYHGNTTSMIDVSPYKFDGPGGAGRKPWVHVAPLPDLYRGRYGEDEAEAGRKYAGHVEELLVKADGQADGQPDRQECASHTIAAFLAETLPSVGGQIVFPPGYLAEAYKHIRAAGTVCIADEVQVGFGRLGSHFWGFEMQNVVPDVVVLGKPIGNGFPLAAVVTTEDIARSFDNGMEFFSTFGGNPVACAAGMAVLDVLREENLQQNAERVGSYLKSGLQQLQTKHPIIGDVRGLGLFLGIDLVRNRTTREPATEQASYIVNRLRDRGILTGTDGPYRNVIKLRPPLVFSEADADLFLSTLDDVLGEDPALS